MWTLDEAMAVVHALQPDIRGLGFHVALGGGVLNNGESDKDLDLYFLPLNVSLDEENKPGLLALLESYFGPPEPIRDVVYESDRFLYRNKLKFVFDERRIDAFIV